MLTDPALLATLTRHYLFSSLPVTAQRDVASYTCARRLAQGAPVFHQGDSVQHFYILLSGQIKLHRISSDGQEKLVEVIAPVMPSPRPCCSTAYRTTRSVPPR